MLRSAISCRRYRLVCDDVTPAALVTCFIVQLNLMMSSATPTDRPTDVSKNSKWFAAKFFLKVRVIANSRLVQMDSGV